MNAEQIIRNQEQLKTERAVTESHWQECADFALPEKGNITTQKVEGQKVGQQLFDSTAPHCNELLAGTLHGILSNPSTINFDMKTGDELDEDDDVRPFLQSATAKMNFVINNSNYQTEAHQHYLDQTTFGTSAFSTEEDDETVVRFTCHPLQEIFIEEDNKGRIDTIYRLFSWNARQISLEFGEDSLPAELKPYLVENKPDKFEIIHVIYPRDKSALKAMNDEQKKLPKGYKIGSKWVLKKYKLELKESGFQEMPTAVTRWIKVSGEKYGRSVTMKVLADTKMINKMKETTIQGAQKEIRPALQAPDDGFMGEIDQRPDAVNYYRSGTTDRIEPIKTGARIDFGFHILDDTKGAIRQGYYVDQLQLSQTGPQKTATEVDRLTDDAFRLLGPMMGRQQSEFLPVWVNRVWSICIRKKIIVVPDVVAQKLSNKRLLIQYSSLVARSQRSAEGANIQRWIGSLTPIAQVDPSIMDNIDPDKYAKVTADIYGVSAKIMRDSDEKKKVRAGRAQAQEEAAKKAQEAHQAEVVGKVLPAAAQAQMASQQKAGI